MSNIEATDNDYALSGGIVGYMYDGKISKCRNEGKVTDYKGYCGGIVGYILKGEVEACLNTGYINGTDNIGGIGGYLSSGTINNCENQGNILASSSAVGGIIVNA